MRSFVEALRRIASPNLQEKMRREWDLRARENARYYISTHRSDWNDTDFLESGRTTIRQHVLNDMENICQGRLPSTMRVLEIGCGAGRLTNALAEVFAEVHGVDVSGEMIRAARVLLQNRPNAYVYQNNGADLTVLESLTFDFAFSYIVFQHIPSSAIIEGYFREVSRLLRPGALFKCQVNGHPGRPPRNNTWFGAPLSEPDLRDMAARCGFELRYLAGVGTQECWLWCFKNPD